MQNQLIQDIFDLLRLRVKPLAHYTYPRWQMVLLVILLGIAGSVTDKQVIPNVELHVLSSVVSRLLDMLLAAYFYRWWLKQGERWDGKDRLFPLIALTDSVMFIYPICLWIPNDAAGLLIFPLGAFRIFLQITAISSATGVARGHVIGGTLLLFGVSMLVSFPFFVNQVMTILSNVSAAN